MNANFSGKTEQYLFIQLLRDLYYKTECSTKSMIENNLCQESKSIVTKNTNNEYDIKNLFDTEQVEMYSAMRDHLQILFSCYEKNGFFLCPVVKNLLTSTPIMEASVASKTGNFTLGTLVMLFRIFENACQLFSY